VGTFPWIEAEEAEEFLLEKTVAGDSKDVCRLAVLTMAHCFSLGGQKKALSVEAC
jgi:hypothetical protein